MAVLCERTVFSVKGNSWNSLGMSTLREPVAVSEQSCQINLWKKELCQLTTADLWRLLLAELRCLGTTRPRRLPAAEKGQTAHCTGHDQDIGQPFRIGEGGAGDDQGRRDIHGLHEWKGHEPRLAALR